MWLERFDCQYWNNELECTIHLDTTHRCRNCASYKKLGDDIMIRNIDIKEADQLTSIMIFKEEREVERIIQGRKTYTLRDKLSYLIGHLYWCCLGRDFKNKMFARVRVIDVTTITIEDATLLDAICDGFDNIEDFKNFQINELGRSPDTILYKYTFEVIMNPIRMAALGFDITKTEDRRKYQKNELENIKRLRDDIMISLYDQVQKEFEGVDLKVFENFDAYSNSFETSGMNDNYDIFVKECKIQDAKIEGLTKEVERRTDLYREFLEELNCPYEDVYVSLYNGLAKNCGRVNIKSTFSKDEDGNWINETGEVLFREHPYMFADYIPDEPNTNYWISVPDFI